MPEFDPDRFEAWMRPDTGIFQLFYRGKSVPNWHGSAGSRQFFVIGNNEFFVKCQYGEYGSQCKTEAYQWARIEPQDRQYFTELVYACDFKNDAHWTVWRYVDLVSYLPDEQDYIWRTCNRKVNELCRKYDIADVMHFCNGNWWIHNNQPLIVDLGCD